MVGSATRSARHSLSVLHDLQPKLEPTHIRDAYVAAKLTEWNPADIQLYIAGLTNGGFAT
jgi:hypothetical protein